MYASGVLLISLGLTTSFQMGIYATLGIGQAVAVYLNGITLAAIVYSASMRLHDVCLTGSLFFPI
jgi:hypothetical protein